MARKPAKDRDETAAVSVKADTDKTTPATVAETPEDIQDAEIIDETTEEPMAAAPEDISRDSVPDTFTEDPKKPAYVAESTPVARPAPAGPGFVPLLLGGLLAGGIGYGIAYYQNAGGDQTLAAAVAGQATEITALRDSLAAIPAPADVGPLTDAAAQLRGDVVAMTDTLTALDSRLTAVEKQPGADGTLAQTAIAAYERELDGLRSQIEGQQSELQAMMDRTAAQLATTRAEAATIEENVTANTRAVTARAAVDRIRAAIDSGAPFGPALSDLAASTDGPVPDALAQSADGVAPLAKLQADFPDLARAALAAARSAGEAGESNTGLTAFLRNQFDVRSTTPQEGTSTDAILSRVQAALGEGRLNDALAEVASLPEAARSVLTDWTAQGELRAAALEAATGLAAQLNDN